MNAPRTLLLLPLSLLMMLTTCLAQKQNNIWYFGVNAGIDFNTSPPSALNNSPISTAEATSSICDPITGALIFYTDGVDVWNRNHIVMPNGTGLHGGYSSSQSALIVKRPGSSTMYYVFTAGNYESDLYKTNGVQYSLVDISLDGGLGDVTTKNVPLLAPATERVTAIQSCSGPDIWVLTPKWDTDELHAYRLTDTGLVTTPVISSTGFTASFPFYPWGWLQPSPDGTKLAMATTVFGSSSRIDLYDFDKLTGTASNHILIEGTDLTFYGVCFSPDNSKLYFTSLSDTLWQCDLSSGNAASIIASKTFIAVSPVYLGAIQIGPDGKLYVAHYGDTIGVINSPNAAGTACGYVHNGFPLASGTSYLGLNNYVYPNSGPSLDVTMSADTVICSGSPVSLSAAGGATYEWSPPDSLNCTNCPNPIASPMKTTTYHVKVTDAGGCWGIDSVTVTVRPSPSNVTHSSDTAICAGTSVQLSASGGSTYSWTPVDGLSCADCSDPIASPSISTTYRVLIANSVGCALLDSVTVTVLPTPDVVTDADTTICLGDSIRLTAFGAKFYRWSPAVGLSCDTCVAPFARPEVTTTYSVVGSNAGGCSDTASVTIAVAPLLNVDAGTDTTICTKEEAHLHASGAEQFRWEPTDGLSCSYCPDPVAKPKLTTTYLVTGWNTGGCSGTDSVTVMIAPPPKVNAGRTLRICLGDTVRLHASGARTFSWSPTTDLSCDDCPDPLAKPATTTTYTVTGLDSIGCVASDTVTVIVGTSVIALVDGETTICAGDSAQLHASGGTRFDWYPISGLSCSDCPDPVARPDSTTTYTVRVSANGNCVGTDSASLTVTVLPKPTIKIDGDLVICQGGTARIIASGGTSYRWSPDLYLSCSDCPDPVVTPAMTTTYTLLVGAESGCLDSASVTVVVNDPPTIDLGGDRTICSGTSVAIQATGASFYSWSPTEGLSCSDCPDPIASPSTTTTYHVVGRDTAGCPAIDSVTVTVLPTFSVDAGPDTTICPTGVATLAAPVGYHSYRWSPIDDLSCPTCRTTEARPRQTSDYALTVTDADGCSASDTVRVIVDTSSSIVHAHIARNYHLGPGSIADIIVSLDDPLPDVRDLDLSFRYDPSIIQLRQIRRVGTPTESWEVQNENNDRANGRYTAKFHGSDGTDLTSGTLLHLIFSGYVGPVDSSVIDMEIGLPDVECLLVRSTPGLVRIDSLCGLSLRLIEISAENYALDENRPNPFNPTTEIGFSLGMDGPTRLEIFDASGRKVATLVDEHLGPGRYVVTWDAAEYPSGVYYYRLTSGAWSKSEVMMLMK